MKKTIYIHIGQPKTGTSAIQSFLHENRELLEKKYDILYPFLKESAREDRYFINGSFIGEKSNYKSFFEIAKKTRCSKIVLSEECLFDAEEENGSIKNFTKALSDENYDFKIIFYIRNIADFMFSLWGEGNKLPRYNGHVNMKTFIESYSVKFQKAQKHNLELFKEIIKEKGRDAIIAKIYEKEKLKNNNIIEDFLDIFKVSQTDSFAPPSIQNNSLSRKAVDLSTYLPFTGRLNESNLPNLETLSALCESGDNRKIINTIPDKEIKDLCDNFEDINKKFSKELFDGNPLHKNIYPSIYGEKRDPYKPLSNSDISKVVHYITSYQNAKLLESQRHIIDELNGFISKKNSNKRHLLDFLRHVYHKIRHEMKKIIN